MSFLGATLLLLAVWLASVALCTGISWLEVMDRIGRGVLCGISWIKERMSSARDAKAGREVKHARQEVVREEQKKVAERKPPKIEAIAPKVEKSERVEKEKQVPHVREAGRVRFAGALAARRSAAARGWLFPRSARGDVAARRIEAARFRRRSRSRRSASGPGHHALRAAARAGREGRADLESREGPGPRAFGDQRPRRRDHPGQVDHGPRDPERDARDGHARRDHQVEGLRRARLAARAGARQGHRRQPGGGRPRAHAAPAGGRHHRLRQVHRASTRWCCRCSTRARPSTCG